jgi:molybdopterin-guanine dinucleotide biosynthesis protein
MHVRVDVICSAARRTRVSEHQDVRESAGPCAAGDVVLGTVTSVGHHAVIETADGTEQTIGMGNVCAVVLGRRYSTAEFHGAIPDRLSPGDQFDLLNIGGVAGRVLPETSAASGPTVLSYIGHAVDGQGTKLTTFDDPITAAAEGAVPAVILVIGSSMDSGKTTSAGFIIQMLADLGFRVGGGKLTGTSRMKDLFRMRAAGAVDAVDFLDAGWPSTCGLSSEDLEAIYRAIVGRLAPATDVIVTEAADGVFERETELILASREIMGGVGMIVACATDSVSAYGMVNYLSRVHHIVPDFISGIITSLPLFMEELSGRVTVPFFVDSESVRGRCSDLVRRRMTGAR